MATSVAGGSRPLNIGQLRDNEEAVEEINIFVADNDDVLQHQSDINKVLGATVKIKQENNLDVPVVTIHVPVNAEDNASCDYELKYVPKSLIEDNLQPATPTTAKTPIQPKKPIHTYKPASKSALPLKPVQKVQQILPKVVQQRTPIWIREKPKLPGSISNYLYPHDLRISRSRLIIDCPTNIPVAEFKSQLADTTDIITTLDVAPSSKKKVKELNTNSVSKLFAYPGKTHPSLKLRSLYQRHLTSKFVDHETVTDLQLPPLDGTLTPKPVPLKRPAVYPVAMLKKKKVEEVVEEKVVVPEQQVVRLIFKRGDGGESQEIIVLHEDCDSLAADTLQSIEMVLAAAEGESLTDEPKSEVGEQVFICNSGETEYIIVNEEVTVNAESGDE